MVKVSSNKFVCVHAVFAFFGFSRFFSWARGSDRYILIHFDFMFQEYSARDRSVNLTRNVDGVEKVAWEIFSSLSTNFHEYLRKNRAKTQISSVVSHVVYFGGQETSVNSIR